MGYIINFLDTHVRQPDILKESAIEGDLSFIKNVFSGNSVFSLNLGLNSDKVKSYMHSTNDTCEDVFDQLLEVLFEIKSIDELHTFMNRLSKFVIIGDGKHNEEDDKVKMETASLGVNYVTQESIIGAYFTKCFLAFDSLAFDQVIVLWDCLVSFRSPFSAYYESKTATRLSSKQSSTVLKKSKNLMKVFFGSNYFRNDSQGFEILQALIPQPLFTSCIASETLDMMLEAKVCTLDRNDGLSLTSINNILDVLSENDKSLPVSAYYIKYFNFLQDHDYEQAFEHLHRFYDYTMHRHGRAHYHNALFTLATLHAEFESFEEALRAVSEAISVARENKDITALTNIHFWLYNFISLHPDCKVPDFLSSKEQMLQFLKAKSQDTSYGLYSLALQHEALHQLVSCGSLTQTLESLFKSFFISIISNSVSSSVSYCTLEASTWERLGVAPLSLIYNRMSSDLSKKTFNTWPVIESTIQHSEILFDKGDLNGAFQLLESVKNLTTESQISYRQWYWSYMLLKLKHRINEQKIDEAEFILERLAPLVNLSYRTRANYQFYRILLSFQKNAKTNLSYDSWTLMEDLVNENTDILYNLRLILIHIDIILETERSSKALSAILRMIFLSEKASILVYKYYGIVILARVSNEESEFFDSVSLIDSIMPKILETENATLIGFSYRTLGETAYSIASSASLPEKESVLFLKKTLNYLEKAAHYYEKTQNWSAVVKTFTFIKKASSDLCKKSYLLEQENNINTTDDKTTKYFQILNAAEATIYRLGELINQNKKSSRAGTKVFMDNLPAL